MSARRRNRTGRLTDAETLAWLADCVEHVLPPRPEPNVVWPHQRPTAGGYRQEHYAALCHAEALLPLRAARWIAGGSALHALATSLVDDMWSRVRFQPAISLMMVAKGPEGGRDADGHDWVAITLDDCCRQASRNELVWQSRRYGEYVAGQATLPAPASRDELGLLLTHPSRAVRTAALSALRGAVPSTGRVTRAGVPC